MRRPRSEGSARTAVRSLGIRQGKDRGGLGLASRCSSGCEAADFICKDASSVALCFVPLVCSTSCGVCLLSEKSSGDWKGEKEG